MIIGGDDYRGYNLKILLYFDNIFILQSGTYSRNIPEASPHIALWARPGPGRARPGRDPARAVKGRAQLFFGGDFFEKVVILSKKRYLAKKNTPVSQKI